jgi:hypothetical protein
MMNEWRILAFRTSPERQRRRPSLALGAGWSVVLLLCTTAAAHDGGFGHSRRELFFAAPSPDELILEYRLQHNRDDALVEMTLMDADRDGQVSAAERNRFLTERASQLAKGLTVKTAAGDPVPLKLGRVDLDHTLTQTFRFSLVTAAKELLLDDRNFPHKPGLIHVRQAEGLTVELARPVDLSHAERVTLRIKR